MAHLKEWKYRVICIHIEDFIVLFFFSPEPLDYITISTRQILLIKVEANFLGLSSESHRGGAQGRKWFAKNTLNTEADLIHV